MTRRIAALLLVFLVLPALAQEPADSLEKALKAYKAQNFQSAFELFKESAEYYESNKVWGNAAECWWYAGRNCNEWSKSQPKTAHPLAIEAFTKAAKLYGDVDEKRKQLNALIYLSDSMQELGRWDDSEAPLTQASSLANQLGDRKLESLAVARMGTLLEVSHRWQEALVVTKRLISLLEDIEPQRALHKRVTLASIHQILGENRLAERNYKKAIRGFVASNDAKSTVDAKARLVRLYMQLDEYEKAEPLALELVEDSQLNSSHLAYTINYAKVLQELSRYREALSVLEGLKPTRLGGRASLVASRRVELLFLLNENERAEQLLADEVFESDAKRAQVAAGLSRKALAKRYFLGALEKASSTEQARLRNLYAVRLIRWGELDAAGLELDRAEAGLGAELSPLRSSVLMNKGELLLIRGRAAEALAYFERAESGWELPRDRFDLATLLNNRAAALQALGRRAENLEVLKRAMEIADKFQKPRQIQGTLATAMGYAYGELGRYQEAESYHRKALSLHRGRGYIHGMVVANINLSFVMSHTDRPKKEREFLLEALKLAERHKMEKELMRVYSALGVLESRSSPTQAMELYRKALAIAENSGENSFLIILLNNMGRAEMAQSNFDRAEEFLGRSKDLLKVVDNRRDLYSVQHFEFDLARNLKDRARVVASMKKLVDLAETELRGLSVHSARSYVEGHTAKVRSAFSFLIQDETLSFVFDMEERLRALGLAAMTSGLQPNNSHIPHELEVKRANLDEQLRDLIARGGSQADIERVETQGQQVLDRIERVHLASGVLTRTRAVTAEDVVRELRDDEALLEFVARDNKLTLIKVTSTGISSRPLGPLKPIHLQAVRIYRALVRKKSKDKLDRELATLSELLLKPYKDELSGIKKLIIVPSGPLFSVPFAALRWEDGYLIDRFEVSTSASATSWHVSRKSRPKGTGGMVGALGTIRPSGGDNFTALPATVEEAKTVSKYLQSPVRLVGADMTASALRERSKGSRTLHFATHGKLNSERPLYSGLAGSDRLVTAANIFGWTLDADLAVLSACNSGVVTDGRAYTGLTAAFQFAGVRSLVVTLWSVDDQATADWMRHFYSTMADGETVSSALRIAHRKLRTERPHPYFWAPFVLWGDGQFSPLDKISLRTSGPAARLSD